MYVDVNQGLGNLPHPLRARGMSGVGSDLMSGASSWLSPSSAFQALPTALTSVYDSTTGVNYVAVGLLAVPVVGVLAVVSMLGGRGRRRRR
jgi:hypothetical protein